MATQGKNAKIVINPMPDDIKDWMNTHSARLDDLISLMSGSTALPLRGDMGKHVHTWPQAAVHRARLPDLSTYSTNPTKVTYKAGVIFRGTLSWKDKRLYAKIFGGKEYRTWRDYAWRVQYLLWKLTGRWKNA